MDLINRQAVLDALNNIEIPRNASWYQYYQQALTAVDKLPPAPTTEVATDINVATKDGTNLAEVGTDLISRDAVKELLNNNGLPYHINPVLWKELNDLPSAQPEIIRCAECKWFQCNMRQDGYLPKGVDEFECRHWCGYCDPTDFCSYAERR